MSIESISEARAIAREFLAMRNIAEWNQMFPHMQVRWMEKRKAGVIPFELKAQDPKSIVPWTFYVEPLEGMRFDPVSFIEACQSDRWAQVSLPIGEVEGEVIDGLRDLAICCRTSDLKRWFTKPLALKKSKSPYAAKLRDLLPRVRHMESCLSLLR
mgnify:FL=1|jgi:hypothetical protein|nr:MAG TPA: hypothetical protein [Caudoviricetes sp.]